MSLWPAGRRSARHDNRVMNWTVERVMTKGVVTVGPEAGFKECADLMRVHGVSALPVLDASGQVLGVLSESDLLAKEEAKDSKPRLLDMVYGRRRRAAAGRVARDLMSSPPITVKPSATVAQAASLMHSKRVKRLPVVDDYGWLVGIVSRADLLRTFLRSDEAIRREVVEQVLHERFVIDPRTVDVSVRDGLVRIRGQVETRSLAHIIEREIAAVEGTVGVDSTLSFRFDDTGVKVGEPPGALQLSALEREPSGR